MADARACNSSVLSLARCTARPVSLMPLPMPVADSPTRTCASAAEYCASVRRDRKSTRLNSSHSQISYAVFCLKKKKKLIIRQTDPLKNIVIAGAGYTSLYTAQRSGGGLAKPPELEMPLFDMHDYH